MNVAYLATCTNSSTIFLWYIWMTCIVSQWVLPYFVLYFVLYFCYRRSISAIVIITIMYYVYRSRSIGFFISGHCDYLLLSLAPILCTTALWEMSRTILIHLQIWGHHWVAPFFWTIHYSWFHYSLNHFYQFLPFHIYSGLLINSVFDSYTNSRSSKYLGFKSSISKYQLSGEIGICCGISHQNFNQK